MNRTSLRTFVLLIGLTLLAGCRTAPVYNVSQAPIMIVKKTYTMEDIEKAILRAGASLGWQIQLVDTGHMLGTLYIRSHMAQVDITYNPRNYSIRYKNSSNLDYDGSNIHRNYNGWIQNLDNAIKRELIAI
jgi:hypothetical protein